MYLILYLNLNGSPKKIGSQYTDALNNASHAASNVLVFVCVSNRWMRITICRSHILFRYQAKLDLQVMTKAGLDSQTQEVWRWRLVLFLSRDSSCLKLKGVPGPFTMGFAFPCFNLILTTLALAELRIPEKELADLQLDRLQQEAELVESVTLPEECQRLVSS